MSQIIITDNKIISKVGKSRITQNEKSIKIKADKIILLGQTVNV